MTTALNVDGSVHVSFEGIDGSGKTETTRAVCAELQRLGVRFAAYEFTQLTGRLGLAGQWLYYRDHRGLIRKIADADRLRGLFFLVNGRRRVKSALEGAEVSVVVGDRSVITIDVLFPALNRAPLAWFKRVAVKGLDPEYVLFLDVSVECALRRLRSRRSRAGNETTDRLVQTRSAYHSLREVAGARRAGGHRVPVWVQIDGDRPFQLVVKDATAALRAVLEGGSPKGGIRL